MTEVQNMGRQKPVIVQVSDTGKLQPQAKEFEEAVLGALMLEKDAYYRVCEMLKPESFYEKSHQLIYLAIIELAIDQRPIDMLTVTAQLLKSGKLEDAGGPSYITHLVSKISSSAHLEYHTKEVVNKFLARELIRYSGTIQGKAFDETTDIEELMQEAEGELFQLSQRNIRSEAIQINTIIKDAVALISNAASQKEGITGLKSGFTGLDNITSGWQKSDLIIIAARPAMGKTAFVLSMAKNMAVNFDIPVAIFSLEMSSIQLVNRLIVNVTEISGEKIKSGRLEEYEWKQLDEKLTALNDVKIFVDETPGLTVTELRTKARRLVREHDIQCLFIDYLQLMNASGMKFGNSREQEVSFISRSLKGLAKELNIPVIVLSQLNRKLEDRQGEGKRPHLADLRESGAIEQDADIVCFIHRPEVFKMFEDSKGNSMIGVAEIIVAKHRNGATGDVRLHFRSELAKFMNMDEVMPVREYTSKASAKDGDTPEPITPAFGDSVSEYDDNSEKPF